MMIPEYIVKMFHLFVYETTRYLSPFVIATEWVLVAIAVLLVCFAPNRLSGLVNDLHDVFKWFSGHRNLAILAAGILPVSLRLMMIRFAGYPRPSIHDEFSHLLLADTLASGRLTNPTHPMWRHFESIHIIQRPSYNSMYPPGQALFLAFGGQLFHHPWYGVLISVGLMGVAVCWMLQGFLPDVWALYGSIIMALKIGVVGFWMNSYMGGAVGAIGGALVVGSLPRLSSKVQRMPVVLLSAGMFLLMNSRPFEGAILSVAILGLIIYRQRAMFKSPWHEAWKAVVIPSIPGVCVFILGVAFTGYYCYRVTGSAVKMPYAVNRETYGWPENLAVLPPKKLHLDHPLMQAMYEKEIKNRDHYSTGARIIDSWDTRIFDCWSFFVGPVLTLPLILIPRAVRSTDHRVLVSLIGLEALVNVFQLLLYPQHLAHVTGVIFALLTLGFWYLYRLVSKVSLTKARYMALMLPISLALVSTMKFLAQPLEVPVSFWERAYEGHRDARFTVEHNLALQPGKQVVIVHYSADHSPDQEWVYNRADIDDSQVIWARDMGNTLNMELVNYFQNRHFWLLDVDRIPIAPVPYSAAALADVTSADR